MAEAGDRYNKTSQIHVNNTSMVLTQQAFLKGMWSCHQKQRQQQDVSKFKEYGPSLFHKLAKQQRMTGQHPKIVSYHTAHRHNSCWPSKSKIEHPPSLQKHVPEIIATWFSISRLLQINVSKLFSKCRLSVVCMTGWILQRPCIVHQQFVMKWCRLISSSIFHFFVFVRLALFAPCNTHVVHAFWCQCNIL